MFFLAKLIIIFNILKPFKYFKLYYNIKYLLCQYIKRFITDKKLLIMKKDVSVEIMNLVLDLVHIGQNMSFIWQMNMAIFLITKINLKLKNAQFYK